LISAINILSIFNLFALAFLIGLRKQNIVANRILALTLICSASDFVINFLSYQGLLDDFYFLLFFNFSFLWAPLVSLYVLLMLGIKWKFKFKYLAHLIPQFLSWTYWIYVLYLDDHYLQGLLTDRKSGIYSWQMQSFQIIIMLQAIFYLGYSARLIRKKQTDAHLNHVPAIRFQWLKQFIYILSGLIFLLIVCSFFVSPVIIDYIVAPILYGISNIFLVYKGLSSSGIFTDVQPAEQSVTLSKERYTGSNLKQELITDYKSKLLKYLQEEEPFTNPELTLNDLSAATDIQTHHLSQIINQEFGKNFFDLINSYRIEKSKSLMQDSKTDNFTIEAIGLESGFGSASSFYRSFKKHTGITPKAFLKTQKLK
jgi:AraC-like DNA-binding protein